MTTRAAVITGGGAAGIAVIRLTGEATSSILERIFTPRGKSDGHEPGRLMLGDVYDQDQKIDEALVHVDEEGVEIHCHGGQRIIQRLLLLLKRCGVEVVDWEELSPEGGIVQDIERTLPRALTELAVRAVLGQYPGGLWAWTAKAMNDLKYGVNGVWQRIRNEAAALGATYRWVRNLLVPARVVLLGPVNAGKSTLANALGGRRQSITAAAPGVTRDWTSQLIDINGLPVELIDTAGHRDTDDTLERQAWRRGWEQAAGADLILAVFDAAETAPETIQAFIRNHQLKQPLVVFNKCDLAEKAFAHGDSVRVSALQTQGLDELRGTMVARLGLAGFDPALPLVFTARQERILTDVARCNDEEAALILLRQLQGHD